MAEQEKGTPKPHLILPVGTQVVSRIELRDSRGTVLCPAGAVGEIVQAPLDGTHAHPIPPPLLPVGTRWVSRIELRDSRGTVLCPAGGVGEIVQAPRDGTHAYRIRLP